ncbi:MAG TPA: hypothetical protein VJ915_08975 [Balneolaceae bacterium]|nr:hypothetical protein [Balneolaceae bacterium]
MRDYRPILLFLSLSILFTTGSHAQDSSLQNEDITEENIGIMFDRLEMQVFPV